MQLVVQQLSQKRMENNSAPYSIYLCSSSSSTHLHHLLFVFPPAQSPELSLYCSWRHFCRLGKMAESSLQTLIRSCGSATTTLLAGSRRYAKSWLCRKIHYFLTVPSMTFRWRKKGREAKEEQKDDDFPVSTLTKSKLLDEAEAAWRKKEGVEVLK